MENGRQQGEGRVTDLSGVATFSHDANSRAIDIRSGRRLEFLTVGWNSLEAKRSWRTDTYRHANISTDYDIR